VEFGKQHNRAVLIRTTFGTVEGLLASSGMLRLLDDLNVVAKRFLTVNEPVVLSGPGLHGDGPLSLNKDSVVFVKEREGSSPHAVSLRLAGRFTRAGVEIVLKEHAILGHVHVLPNGDPISRFNQGEQTFVALTSVTVVGPEERFVTPFLALNRGHIQAVRPVGESERLALVEPQESDLAAPLDDPVGI
jgi:hypothetical protein